MANEDGTKRSETSVIPERVTPLFNVLAITGQSFSGATSVAEDLRAPLGNTLLLRDKDLKQNRAKYAINTEKYTDYVRHIILGAMQQNAVLVIDSLIAVYITRLLRDQARIEAGAMPSIVTMLVARPVEDRLARLLVHPNHQTHGTTEIEGLRILRSTDRGLVRGVQQTNIFSAYAEDPFDIAARDANGTHPFFDLIIQPSLHEGSEPHVLALQSLAQRGFLRHNTTASTL